MTVFAGCYKTVSVPGAALTALEGYPGSAGADGPTLQATTGESLHLTPETPVSLAFRGGGAVQNNVRILSIQGGQVRSVSDGGGEFETPVANIDALELSVPDPGATFSAKEVALPIVGVVALVGVLSAAFILAIVLGTNNIAGVGSVPHPPERQGGVLVGQW